MTDGLFGPLLVEILSDSHRYAPGVGQHRPTSVDHPTGRGERARTAALEGVRDAAERLGARAGFTRRHFQPAAAAAALERVIELREGFERTHALLGDERSRRALLDLLKLRVLGPYHAPLPLGPADYRAKQAYARAELRRQWGTVEVSDPYFSPLSLFELPSGVSLHSHSVDIVSVFLLDQYSYRHGAGTVAAEPGDVVFDVGGCWGDTALYFAELVGPAGRVYTFEFDPENLAVMRANLALNPELAGRIEVVERALWHSSGEELGFVPGGRMTSLGGGGAAEHTTTTITLDDFVAEIGIERLDLVKMDVEGAELDVLAGAAGSLPRFTPKLALAAYHRDDDLITIPNAIEAAAPAAGYRYFLDTFSPLEDETVLFASSST